MRRAKVRLLVSMAVVPALLAISEKTEAQFRKPQAGVYGGVAVPTGDFKDESGTGWHVGGMIKARVTGAVDLRLDGAFTRFGSKDFDFGTSTVNLKSKLTFGTLNAELNLGADSAAYPGDNSISPYITAGPGVYRLEFEATCAGVCTDFDGELDSKTKVGVNVGAGANIPVRGFHTFAEARYHRFGTMFPSTELDGNATLITATFGVKFR